MAENFTDINGAADRLDDRTAADAFDTDVLVVGTEGAIWSS